MDELHSMIESYPTRLAAALRARDEAAHTVEQLTAQIEAAAARPISLVDLNLDHELSLLEVAYERLRGEVELEYRRISPKPTEAAIAAMVRADARLVEAKRACLEKRYERNVFNRRASYTARHSETATSPEVERLRADLETARAAHEEASRHLEMVKAQLLSYQILTQFQLSVAEVG